MLDSEKDIDFAYIRAATLVCILLHDYPLPNQTKTSKSTKGSLKPVDAPDWKSSIAYCDMASYLVHLTKSEEPLGRAVVYLNYA